MLEQYNRLATGSECNFPKSSISGVTGVSQDTIGPLSDIVRSKAMLYADMSANRIHPQVDVHSQDLYILGK